MNAIYFLYIFARSALLYILGLSPNNVAVKWYCANILLCSAAERESVLDDSGSGLVLCLIPDTRTIKVPE